MYELRVHIYKLRVKTSRVKSSNPQVTSSKLWVCIYELWAQKQDLEKRWVARWILRVGKLKAQIEAIKRVK